MMPDWMSRTMDVPVPVNGSQIATAWSEVLDANGKQLAIGRGTFLASAAGVAP